MIFRMLMMMMVRIGMDLALLESLTDFDKLFLLKNENVSLYCHGFFVDNYFFASSACNKSFHLSFGLTECHDLWKK